MERPTDRWAESAEFHNVSVAGGLVVRDLRLTGGSGTVCQDPFEITLEEATSVEARLSEIDLQDYLAKSLPKNVKELKVRFIEGYIELQAAVAMIFEVRGSMKLNLRIADPTKVFVELVSSDIMGGKANPMIQTQLSQVNPVIDTHQFPIYMEIASISIVPGEIILTGKAFPPK